MRSDMLMIRGVDAQRYANDQGEVDAQRYANDQREVVAQRYANDQREVDLQRYMLMIGGEVDAQ